MYPNNEVFLPYGQANGQIIVASAYADVTGDGYYDQIFLTGSKESDSPYVRNITLLVREGQTNVLNVFPLTENAGYEPTLSFYDFTGDGVSDILVTIQSGGSGGIIFAYIYSYQNGRLTKVFDSITFNEQHSYKVNYENDYKVSIVSSNPSKRYILDLQYKGTEYLNEIYNPDGILKQPIEGWVDPVSGLYPIHITSQNGKYYILTNEQIAGRFHADSLGYVENLLNWSNGQFQIVRQTVSIYGENIE